MGSDEGNPVAGPQPMNSGLNIFGHIIVDSHYAQADGDHYPYDCPMSHCISKEDSCHDEHCLEKLITRLEQVHNQSQEILKESLRLEGEIEALNGTIASKIGKRLR
jgi:hypothetical protein